MTTLDSRTLNRATLARQLLLQRSDASVTEALTQVGGLQAQEPQEPYVGLWSRLDGFTPDLLVDPVLDRRVVRLALMRRTVHLLTADDALAWRSRHDAMLRQKVLGVYRAELEGVDLDELAAAGRDVLADGEPRTMGDMARAVADRWPDVGVRPLGEMLMAALVPVAQLPPRGVWRSTGGARYLPLATWLGREPDALAADGDPVGVQLVRRYLAAFGPAASADLRAWCGVAGLPAAVKAVRDELVSYRDERGRELLDLPGAPLPDPDTPAPVRFLPAFDNVVLGYDDRSRVIDTEHRGLSIAGTRFVLVDGRVAGTWTSDDTGVVVTPLRRWSRAEQDEVAAEAAGLASFLSDGESSGVTIASA